VERSLLTDYSLWKVSHSARPRKAEFIKSCADGDIYAGRIYRMTDDSSTNFEYGPVKFRVIFEQGMNFSINRILQRPEAQVGSLSAGDIRAELQRFKASPGEDTTPIFNNTLLKCTFAADRLRWDKESRYPLECSIVNTFMHLLLTSYQVPIQREHLSRRIIPRFVEAMLQMLKKTHLYVRRIISCRGVAYGIPTGQRVQLEDGAARLLRTVFAEITHDHRDLFLGLNRHLAVNA
jgi:hypothetical protein